MKKTTLVAALLIASSSLAFAQSTSKGASEPSPEDQMKDKGSKTNKGASEFTPGDKMKDQSTKTKKGTSEFAPGDKMNDKK